MGDAYWNLSQYEIGLQFKGAHQRRVSWYELGLWVAWHVAAFSRGKLPALAPMLERLRAKPADVDQPQDWRVVKAHMQALREAQNKAVKPAPQKAGKRRG